MHSDPVADYLTRLRNAAGAGHASVEMNATRLLVSLSQLLLAEGYIRSFEVLEDRENPKRGHRRLRVNLKYDVEGYPVIRKIKRVSRPGLRVYFGSRNLPRVLNGAGVAVVSTNKGLLTDREARKRNVGGELLCTLY
ncbi:MAG: 30S ribosomal protein S8 [Vampirovibrionales bacterium]|nr:30S ribosomal protein S8 [Vampirovibrionales bacterium]